MKKTNNILYTLCILSAGILWGFTGIFVRWFSARGITSMQAAVLRSAATVIILFLFLLFAKRSCFKVRLRDLWLFMLMGLFSVTAFNCCYFNAIIKLQSMSVASVLLYTSPVFVMIMSTVFFKEKITAKRLVAVLLTFTGCVLVSGVKSEGLSLSASGIALGIGAGVSYALYSIIGKFALKKNYNPLTVVFYMWVFGFIFTLPLGQTGNLTGYIKSNPSDILVFFLFGLISAVLPYALYTLGLRHISAGTAAILSTTEPCTASLIGVIGYAEPFTPALCTGIIAIIASVVLINMKHRNRTGSK